MYRWRLAALFFSYHFFFISWHLLLSYSPELPEGREEGDEDMKFPTPDDMTVWKDEYLTDDHHAPERETYQVSNVPYSFF